MILPVCQAKWVVRIPLGVLSKLIKLAKLVQLDVSICDAFVLNI